MAGFNLHVGVVVMERPPWLGRGGRVVTELGPFPWVNPRKDGDRIVSDPVTITNYPVGELLIHEAVDYIPIDAVPPGELTLRGMFYAGHARVPR